MVSVDRRVRVGSIELRSPVMTASGTAGYGNEFAPYFDLSSIGAVVTKSIAAFEWAGNPAPRVHPTPQGMINAVGLQGPGIAHWLAHDLPEYPTGPTGKIDRAAIRNWAAERLGRSAPMPQEVLERLNQVQQAHRDLAYPRQVGSTISLNRLATG